MTTITTLPTGAALAALMLAIAVSDWRRFRVPDALTVLALILRGVDIVVAAPGMTVVALRDDSLRACVVAALFYLFRTGYRRLRGREGLGLGDVKLAGVAGAWVEWELLPYVIEAAALVSLALAVFRARRSSEGFNGAMRLPFAVGFAPAIFLGWSLGAYGF
jgi:leader peptidase (prepilin peptidase)/N-methyltransferase